jgi:molybdopterin-guanine dinucleotide biosynthesis protein A
MPPSVSQHDTLRATGAVLAGGKSTRMGQDKASMRLSDGRMMIEHVVDALASVCEEVIIVGANSPSLGSGHRVIQDERPGMGPLSGIASLLQCGIADNGQYLICPCDIPLITPELLTLLLQLTNAPAHAFRIQGNAYVEPLPLRVSAAAAPVAQKMLDERDPAVWRLLQQLQPEIVEINSTDATRLRNVNTQADYQAILNSDSSARAKSPPPDIRRVYDR